MKGTVNIMSVKLKNKYMGGKVNGMQISGNEKQLRGRVMVGNINEKEKAKWRKNNEIEK